MTNTTNTGNAALEGIPRGTSEQFSAHRTGWYIYDSLELDDYPDDHFDDLEVLDDFDLEAALRDGLSQAEGVANGDVSDDTAVLDVVDRPDGTR